MAGFSAEEATKALPDTLSLAAAGGMELAQSADLASNVLQQFALEVDETGRVADVLAQAAASSNTSVAQLGEGMKMAGPIANAAGLSIEETAAAMGKMGDAGIQASMAGTSLRGAMTRLLNASGPAEEALDRLGITAENADGTLRPLPDIIDQLADSGATAGDMMEIFGQRAGPAMAALVEQGGDSLRDLTAELENSSGAAEEMAKVRMDNLSGDLQKLKSAAEGAGIALFEAGLGDLLRDAAQGATAAVQGFAELPDPLLKASIAIGGVTAATGPAILGVGMLANAAPAIAANFRAGRTQLRRFATFMAGPWGAAVFAGAALLNTMKNNAVDTSGAIASLEAELGGMKATSDALSDMFLIEGLRDAGVLTTFDELGLSLDDLRTAALGNEDALSRLVGPIDELEFSGEGWSDALHNVTFGLAGARSPAEDLRAELLGLVEGTDEYNAAAEVLAEKGLEKARTATRELGSHMERMPAVFNNGRDAFDGLSEAALKQAEALELAEEASKRALEQLNEYLDAQRAATDPVFALNDALRGVEEAQANFNETSKDSEATQADVERAAFDLTEALVSLEVAALDNELSFEDFERQLERWIEDERIGQEEADALRQRVEELTGASEDYEGEYIATLVADVGEAEGAIDALIDALMEAGFTRGQAAASARWTARANVEITTSGPGSDIHNVVPNLRTEARASGGLMYPGTLYMTGEEGP
ncbi:MAG: phage tail tape measure protein, partial [Nitriliruptoraceae bacterium]